MRAHLGRGLFRKGDQRPVRLVPLAMRGHRAVKILFHHSDGAADQIAKIVGEVGVDARQKRLVTELPVAAKGHFPHKKITDGIAAVAVAQHNGIHHVAQRLAHLHAVQHQPAMPEYLLGQRQVKRMQDYRPDNGMEPHDLLAHKMNIGRPVPAVQAIVRAFVAQGRDVVGQRVQPYVNGMLLVKVHRHAPFDGCAADAQVGKPRAEKVVEHFILARRGLDEVRMALNIVDQPILILVKPEEISLLTGLFHGAAAIRAAAVL